MNLQAPVRPAALGADDYRRGAAALGGSVLQLAAVKEVESGGAWFTDIRQQILDLDGPGGFIDGAFLPKILFEAHLFSADTEGRFDRTHPAISAPEWTPALYVGGQGEYARLHAAMQLDVTAALRSASWGMFQILGRNHLVCGYPTVQAFVAAMKRGEAEHLQAFVGFVKGTGLAPAFRRISGVAADCAGFARGYNGRSYAKHNYHGKIAAAVRRRSA